MAAPELEAEEYQLLDDGVGILLNGSVALPFVDIASVQGIDANSLRTNITPREGMHGSGVESLYESERTIVLEGQVYASVTELETYLDSLKANWAPSRDDQPFYIGTDAGTRMVFGKPQGFRYNKDTLRRIGSVAGQFTLICGDPRIYDITTVSQNLPGSLVLSGNRESGVVITINGARTNPTITLGGKTMTITYTLTAGNEIEIDVLNRTVYLNGSTNIRSALSFSVGATWEDFMLSPGANAFTLGGTGAGTITAVSRSAWW